MVVYGYISWARYIDAWPILSFMRYVSTPRSHTAVCWQRNEHNGQYSREKQHRSAGWGSRLNGSFQ